ncbi:MAG: 3'(2'),5'-bisphosphate nucleotidase [Myxococcota bacterium]|nr:3'(2'),5'-bisphosphate nucleotidase [Myxococcota bacterium]
MPYAEERRIAIEAVERASFLCRTVQANLVAEASMDKKDKSPVTVADFGAQAVVTHALRGAFPELPLVGEEDAAELRDPANRGIADQVVAHVAETVPGIEADAVLDLIDYGTYPGGGSGRHWTLDPIDGTKGFLRLDQYAVALALIEDGEVVLGVLGCPNMPLDASDPDGERGCLFVAVKGEGAFRRALSGGPEEGVAVTRIDDPSQAKFCESVEAAHSSQSDSAQVAQKLGITAEPFRIDSQCKYGAVSRGDASIYLRLPTRADYEEKIWDHAAGAIVVREAGGKVTDIRGRELDFSLGRTLKNNSGVIVTNGALHDRVIEAVGEVLGF